MRVGWLTGATKALIAAHDYIAQDNPKATQEYFRDAIASAEQFVQYPQTGHTSRMPGNRELVLVKRPYIIPYRVKIE